MISTDTAALELVLTRLAAECEAWATVVLVPDLDANVLRVIAAHNLPPSWSSQPNRLDSNSMNARAYLGQREVCAEHIEDDLPPGKPDAEPHRMTASIVIPIPEIGTLEVIADTNGYTFDSGRRAAIIRARDEIAAMEWR